jgi:tRNA-binding protein
MKSPTEYATFEALDIRVGRVLEVVEARTRKPTYRMTIDFGPEIGTKVSCGALRNYPPEELVGSLVIGVVNFPPMRMGPETSEVLVLGVPGDGGGTIRLTPESEVAPGAAVF